MRSAVTSGTFNDLLIYFDATDEGAACSWRRGREMQLQKTWAVINASDHAPLQPPHAGWHGERKTRQKKELNAL